MRGNEAAQLEHEGSSHEQRADQHAVRHRLRGHGEEEKVGLLPALVLRGGVAHGENQALEEGDRAKVEVVQRLSNVSLGSSESVQGNMTVTCKGNCVVGM